MPRHAQQFAGDPNGDAAAQKTFDESRRNFLALVFCLMVGTAALPHILMRYYTTPSVKEARESVTWSLFFIFLLYFTAPALAVLVKYEVFNVLVGTPFDKLPDWIAAWSKVDPALLSVVDINKDGILQLGEMRIGGDIIVLATPEIGGLPYVVSGMVAAGGLAAALSTADGLLLTIANALSHDLYYKMIDPNASTARRVTISKVLLLVVALAAASVAAQKPADILFLVSAAFSFAAAAFFPALVLGIFWKRASKWGASLGMIAGLGITFYYMVMTQPWLRGVFGVTSPMRPVVRHPADLGRRVRRAAGLCGDHHRQPVRAGAVDARCRSWSSTCATRTSRRRRPRLTHDMPGAPPQRRRPLPGLRGDSKALFACAPALYSRAFPLPHPLAGLRASRTLRGGFHLGTHKECSCVTTRSSC